MNSPARRLSREYAGALGRHLLRPQERLLQQAYELGRQAIARGLGVLDIARIHQQALVACIAPDRAREDQVHAFEITEAFFLEALSPFEAHHRGFREANLRLRQLNHMLESRNAEMAAQNRELAREVSQRKRTEQALRESEDHYRQLFHQARQMQENLRLLSRRILFVQEEERKRISRELHDEVGQALAAINMNLGMLQSNGAVGEITLKEQIAAARSLLGQTMEGVHRFARELRPAMLDELDLLPALRSCLRGFAERTGLRVRFQGAAEAEQLNDEQKLVVFRVTQESLTNVAKHARASRVAVTLRRVKDRVQVRIKDNGKSFPVDEQLFANGGKRLGLLGMQERVRLVNGHLALHSAPGQGTTVRVELPFKAGGYPGAGENRYLARDGGNNGKDRSFARR